MQTLHLFPCNDLLLTNQMRGRIHPPLFKSLKSFLAVIKCRREEKNCVTLYRIDLKSYEWRVAYWDATWTHTGGLVNKEPVYIHLSSLSTSVLALLCEHIIQGSKVERQTCKHKDRFQDVPRTMYFSLFLDMFLFGWDCNRRDCFMVFGLEWSGFQTF